MHECQGAAPKGSGPNEGAPLLLTLQDVGPGARARPRGHLCGSRDPTSRRDRCMERQPASDSAVRGSGLVRTCSSDVVGGRRVGPRCPGNLSTQTLQALSADNSAFVVSPRSELQQPMALTEPQPCPVRGIGHRQRRSQQSAGQVTSGWEQGLVHVSSAHLSRRGGRGAVLMKVGGSLQRKTEPTGAEARRAMRQHGPAADAREPVPPRGSTA